MSENRFFQNIRSVMVEYRPEAPQSVYAGMRRKLWWSNFTKISITRFNVWYAVLMVSSIALWFNYTRQESLPATEMVQSESSQVPEQNLTTPAIQEQQQAPWSEESVAAEAEVKPSQESAVRSTSNNTVAVNDELTVVEKSSAAAEKDGIDPSQQKPVNADSSASVSKGMKKGLKVKTFQVSDK